MKQDHGGGPRTTAFFVYPALQHIANQVIDLLTQSRGVCASISPEWEGYYPCIWGGQWPQCIHNLQDLLQKLAGVFPAGDEGGIARAINRPGKEWPIGPTIAGTG